jgi:hypothetical protein
MAKGFICDLTGGPCTGEPAHVVTVGDNKSQFKAEIRVFRKSDATTFVEADLGPEAVARIKKAAESILDKPAGK